MAAAEPAIGPATADDARLMAVLQGGRCFYCQQAIGAKATFDHVIPRCFGGIDSPANIVLAHRRCNRLKADRLPGQQDCQRFIDQRRGSRLGVWPPIRALLTAPPEEAWLIVARAVAQATSRG